jgi:hypothetical protein
MVSLKKNSLYSSHHLVDNIFTGFIQTHLLLSYHEIQRAIYKKQATNTVCY